MKYKARTNLVSDYWHYLAQEHLYHILFGHGTNSERRKADYIWKRLLSQYK